MFVLPRWGKLKHAKLVYRYYALRGKPIYVESMLLMPVSTELYITKCKLADQIIIKQDYLTTFFTGFFGALEKLYARLSL